MMWLLVGLTKIQELGGGKCLYLAGRITAHVNFSLSKYSGFWLTTCQPPIGPYDVTGGI